MTVAVEHPNAVLVSDDCGHEVRDWDAVPLWGVLGQLLHGVSGEFERVRRKGENGDIGRQLGALLSDGGALGAAKNLDQDGRRERELIAPANYLRELIGDLLLAASRPRRGVNDPAHPRLPRQMRQLVQLVQLVRDGKRRLAVGIRRGEEFQLAPATIIGADERQRLLHPV